VNAAALDNLIAANPGADDAAVLTLCAADPRTVAPIKFDKLTPWLNAAGRKSRLRRTLASGAFAAVVTATLGAGAVQAASDQLGDALDYLSSPHNDQLDSDSNDPDPNDPAGGYLAQKTSDMLALMVACNGVDPTLGFSADERAAFLGFGGGYALRDATKDDVAGRRAALAKMAAATALRVRMGKAQANAAHLVSIAELSEAPVPSWDDVAAAFSKTPEPTT
jgi:hypothetical protein